VATSCACGDGLREPSAVRCGTRSELRRAHLTGQAGIAYFTQHEPVEILISVGVIGTVVLVCVPWSSPARLPPAAIPGAAGAGQRRRGRTRRLRVALPRPGLATGIVAGASSMRRVSNVAP